VTAAAIDINTGVVQGFATIAGPVVNNAVLDAEGGTLTVAGGLSGTGQVVFDLDNKGTAVTSPPATLVVAAVSSGQTITMNGDDVLVLSSPGAFAGTIVAGVGDQIVLAGVAATSAVDTNGTLVVSNGSAAVASLVLSGSYAADHFVVAGSTVTVAAGATPTPTPAPTPTPTPAPTPAPTRTVDGTLGAHSTVTFSGPSSDYTITYKGNDIATIVDNGAEGDGTVISVDNEALMFTDHPYFIESGDDANIARLYSAALGRIPDTTGLFGWENFYTNNVSASAKAQGVYTALAETSGGFNGNLSIAQGFIDSPEFQTNYGNLSNQAFVTQLYANVLDRAPDPTGLAGWLNLMTPGNSSGTTYTQAMVLVGFAESPENITKSASWLTDMSKSG
jgi:hypothetical protein